MATNEELTEQVRQLTEQVMQLTVDNQRMIAQSQGGLGAIPALVQAVNRFIDRPEQHNRLADNKGIGKPSTFDGTESKYREWSAKFESFVVGVYGEDFQACARVGCGTSNHSRARTLANSFRCWLSGPDREH